MTKHEEKVKKNIKQVDEHLESASTGDLKARGAVALRLFSSPQMSQYPTSAVCG